MAKSAIRADFDKPLDVHRNVLAQIALDRTFRLDDLADAVDLFFSEILNFLHGIDFGRVQNARRAWMTKEQVLNTRPWSRIRPK